MSAALIMREAFEGHPLTFVEFNGEPVVVARELASALGYADPSRLGDLIRREWAGDFVEGVDYRVLDGDHLSAFKAAWSDTPDGGVSTLDRTRRALMVLTESGWWQVAQRTEKALGVKLRRFLSREVLPKLARGEGIPPASEAAPNLTAAVEHRKMGDRLWRAGDKAGALACYQRGAAALGVTTAPEPSRPVPPPPPAVDEWDRFVTLWRERYGTARTNASELITIAEGAGLFRREFGGRNRHGRITLLGRMLAKNEDRGVVRGKSGGVYVRLLTP